MPKGSNWMGYVDGDLANLSNYNGSGNCTINKNAGGYVGDPTGGICPYNVGYCNITIVSGCTFNGVFYAYSGSVLQGGTYNGHVYLSGGSITGGTYNDIVSNYTSISDGYFSASGSVINYNAGTISGGEFYCVVDNTDGGTLSGGLYHAQTRADTVAMNPGATIAAYPDTVFSDEIPDSSSESSSSSLDDIKYWLGTEDGNLGNANNYYPPTAHVPSGPVIIDTTTLDYVLAPSTGTCVGNVTNVNETLPSGCIWDGNVANTGTITGGIFNGTVDSTGGTINGGLFVAQSRATVGCDAAAAPAALFTDDANYWLGIIDGDLSNASNYFPNSPGVGDSVIIDNTAVYYTNAPSSGNCVGNAIVANIELTAGCTWDGTVNLSAIGGSGTITGGTFNDALEVSNGNPFVFSAGTFNGTIHGQQFRFEGGDFYNTISNNGNGTYIITGGNFHSGVGTLDSLLGRFEISGNPVFDCDINMRCMAGGGSISSGTFNGTVTVTADYVSDVNIISGGTFNGQLNNNGAEIQGGIFNSVVISNLGTISGGNFTSTCTLTTASVIPADSAATFDGPVVNQFEVYGCSFNNVFSNETTGVIYDGTFNADVTNSGSILAGTFNNVVSVVSGGTISDGTFNDLVDVQYSPFTFSDGIFNGDIGCAVIVINGGEYNGTIYNHGGQNITVTGGLFNIGVGTLRALGGALDISGTPEFNCNVTLDGAGGTGVISAGTFHGNVTLTDRDNQTITGGTFDTGTVSSYGTISGTPIFNGPVENKNGSRQGVIDAGTFNSTVDNTDAKINAGLFTAQTRANTSGTISLFPTSMFLGDPQYWLNTDSDGNLNNPYNYLPAGAYTPGNMVLITTTPPVGTYNGAPTTGNCASDVTNVNETLASASCIYEGSFYNGSTVSDGVFSGSLLNAIDPGDSTGKSGTISGGAFTGTIQNWCAVDAHPGTFNLKGTISAGTFGNTVDNGTVVCMAGNPEISGGLFNGVVDNTHGTINAGRFNAQTRVSTGGTISAGFSTTIFADDTYWLGTVNGDLSNAGNYVYPPLALHDPVILDSTVTGYIRPPWMGNCIGDVTNVNLTLYSGCMWEGSFDNKTGGSVLGGIFNGAFIHESLILSGAIFNNTFTAIASTDIQGGTFNGTVSTEQRILDGVFNSTVVFSGASSSCRDGLYNGVVDNSTGGSLVGGYFPDQVRSSAGTVSDFPTTVFSDDPIYWLGTVDGDLSNISNYSVVVNAMYSHSYPISSLTAHKSVIINTGIRGYVRAPSSGTCIGDVTNVDATLPINCTWAGTVVNGGTISGGIFNDVVTNNGTIDGSITTTIFNAVVTNNATINYGRFLAQTRAETGGGIGLCGATYFTDDPIYWRGTSNGNLARSSNYFPSGPASLHDLVVIDTTFPGYVRAPTFGNCIGDVTNVNETIPVGCTWEGTFTNDGTINGGIFNGAIPSNSGTINAGWFKVQNRAGLSGTIASTPVALFLDDVSSIRYWMGNVSGNLSDQNNYFPTTGGDAITVHFDTRVPGYRAPSSGTCTTVTVVNDNVDFDVGCTWNGSVTINGNTINIKGGIFEGLVSIADGNTGNVIYGGTFNGNINSGYYGGSDLIINGGTFNGTVNRGVMTINGGDFNGELHDAAQNKALIINGGTFNGAVDIYWFNPRVTITGGIFNTPAYPSNLKLFGGSITGGDFTLSKDLAFISATTITGGTFKNVGSVDVNVPGFSGTLSGVTVVSGGTFFARAGTINSGTFDGTVMSAVNIAGGTFNGPVVNTFPFGGHGYITGGTFNNTFDNSGFGFGTYGINGGVFNGLVDNTGGKIDKGLFTAQTRVDTVAMGGTVADAPTTLFTDDTSTRYWVGRISGDLSDANNYFPTAPSLHDPITLNTAVGGYINAPSRGTCLGDVINTDVTLSGTGRWEGLFTNNATINGGFFNGLVTNNSAIGGGFFNVQTRGTTGGSVSAAPATWFTDDTSASAYWLGLVDGNLSNDANYFPHAPLNLHDVVYLDTTVGGYTRPPSSGTCIGDVTNVNDIILPGTTWIGTNIISVGAIVDGGIFTGVTTPSPGAIINGGTFSCPFTCNGITVNGGIFNGTFTGGFTASTINDGTFNLPAGVTFYSATINNGDFTGTNVTLYYGYWGASSINGGIFNNVSVYSTSTSVTGGTFNGIFDSATVVSGGTFNGRFNNGYNTGGAAGTINGGTFNGVVYNAVDGLTGAYINNGIFNDVVYNYNEALDRFGYITGGIFNGSLYIGKGASLQTTISGGTFNGHLFVAGTDIGNITGSTFANLSKLEFLDSIEFTKSKGINGSGILGMI